MYGTVLENCSLLFPTLTLSLSETISFIFPIILNFHSSNLGAPEFGGSGPGASGPMGNLGLAGGATFGWIESDLDYFKNCWKKMVSHLAD